MNGVRHLLPEEILEVGRSLSGSEILCLIRRVTEAVPDGSAKRCRNISDRSEEDKRIVF
jgi:hypothetical protein